MAKEAPKREKRTTKKEEVQQEVEGSAPNPEVLEKGKKLKEEIDNIIDEIDDVLEENAEEFVKNYVQKGGE